MKGMRVFQQFGRRVRESARQGFGVRRGVVLRLTMVISLWQGPLPWMHTHSTISLTEELSVAGSNVLLSRSGVLTENIFSKHLKVHHRFIDPDVNLQLGWHIHWIIPQGGFDPRNADTPCNDGLPQYPARDLQCQVCDSSPFVPLGEISFCDPMLNDWPSLAEPLWHRDATRCPTNHFYEVFDTSLSLPQRFSVYRC